VRADDWNRKWREHLRDARHAETTGQPNRLLVAEVGERAPGRALDLACGAGRNAVWLAERGWEVTAVDFSPVALAEAAKLASTRGVGVRWIEADVRDWEPPEGEFDLVLVLYLQVPADERRRVLGRAAGALAPQGTLLVVGHHSDNLADGWGGPRTPDVLYSAEDVAADVPGLVVERAERVLRSVDTDDGERTAIDALVLATAR
jgi:SAM-dependent methyltransferase